MNERNVRQTLKLTSGFKEDNGFRHSVLTAKPCTSTSEAYYIRRIAGCADRCRKYTKTTMTKLFVPCCLVVLEVCRSRRFRSTGSRNSFSRTAGWFESSGFHIHRFADTDPLHDARSFTRFADNYRTMSVVLTNHRFIANLQRNVRGGRVHKL